MGHALVDEFCRCSGEFAPSFLRRCQRVFREEVQPRLDERDVLWAENQSLKAELEKLKVKAEKRRSEAVA